MSCAALKSSWLTAKAATSNAGTRTEGQKKRSVVASFFRFSNRASRALQPFARRTSGKAHQWTPPQRPTRCVGSTPRTDARVWRRPGETRWAGVWACQSEGKKKKKKEPRERTHRDGPTAPCLTRIGRGRRSQQRIKSVKGAQQPGWRAHTRAAPRPALPRRHQHRCRCSSARQGPPPTSTAHQHVAGRRPNLAGHIWGCL